MTTPKSTAAQTKKSETNQKEDTMTQASTTQTGSKQANDNNAIRPFHVNVPEADLTELRRRINATKWPERETVPDCIPRRATRDHSGARALLGDRV